MWLIHRSEKCDGKTGFLGHDADRLTKIRIVCQNSCFVEIPVSCRCLTNLWIKCPNLQLPVIGNNQDVNHRRGCDGDTPQPISGVKRTTFPSIAFRRRQRPQFNDEDVAGEPYCSGPEYSEENKEGVIRRGVFHRSIPSERAMRPKIPEIEVNLRDIGDMFAPKLDNARAERLAAVRGCATSPLPRQ